MKKNTPLSHLIFLSVIFLNISLAQWVKTNGPSGRSGMIYSICTKDSKIFAGTDEGIFVSKDNGRSWQNINPQLPDNYYSVATQAIVIKDEYIFAGIGFYGVYVSSDNGNIWTKANEGLLSNGSPSSMVVSGNKIIGSKDRYLYQTTDNGLSWTKIDSLQRSNAIIAEDSFVFEGTLGGEIFRSTDYGTTWNQVRYAGGSVNSFAKSNNIVYAGAGNSVIQSTNNGLTWDGDSSTLYCERVNAIVISPEESGKQYLFAGTNLGLYRSSDNGANWILKSPGVISDYILTLRFEKDQATGDFILYAGTAAGFFSSTDFGETWNPVGLPVGKWYLTAIGTNLFAGTTTRPKDWAGGNPAAYAYESRCFIFRSTDFGTNWSESDQGLINNPRSVLTSIASSQTASGGFSLFAGATSSRVSSDCYVFASSDLGETWNKTIQDTIPGNTPIVFTDSENVFVGLAGGIFRSTDNGSTWLKSDSGIAMPSPAGQNRVYVNAFSSDGNYLYAGGGYYISGHDTKYYNYIFVSVDNGVSWSPVDSGFSASVSALKSIYTSGSHLLVGTQSTDLGKSLSTGGGIYHILDTDSGWTLIDSSLMGKQICTITSYGSFIFAAATGSGVFRSTDNGTTWKDINEGLKDAGVTSLLVAEPYLFIATGTGVWKRLLSEITSVDIGQLNTMIPEKYSLSQNYPNPFNPATLIRYSIPQTSYITLKVYDLLGKEIATLSEGILQPGDYTATFQGKRIASGMYLYRLKADNFVQTKKLILLK